MKKYKYIFVDCFDTVLLRDIPAEKTKYCLAKQMVDNLKLSIDAEKLYRLFVSAELRLEKQNNKRNEYTISQVLSL